jgi:hypothetical protein
MNLISAAQLSSSQNRMVCTMAMSMVMRGQIQAAALEDEA